MAREERRDAGARPRVAKRPQRVDKGRVAAEHRNLRLQRGPMLLDERPGAGARRGVVEESREVDGGVLRAELRTQSALEAAIDQRGFVKLGERIEKPVLVVR